MTAFRRPLSPAVAVIAGLACSLVACSSAPSATIPRGAPLACERLVGWKVAAASIGLPTGGAIVNSAAMVPANGETAGKAIGAYCKVAVEIAPVDVAAPPIRMQISLPVAWNRKAMMFGGGGYDGTIPGGADNVRAGSPHQPTPLGRGYATFSSDSGHQAGPLGSQDGAFGVNDEALRNFSGDALKKTRDVAIAVLAAHYGVAGPDKAYFSGGSTGGREALAAVQKWPQDWDGAIAMFPAGAAASLDLQFGRIARAFAQPGAYANLEKRKRLYDAAIEACDPLDGVRDGLISHVAACNAAFDPATATVAGAPLRCAGGGEGGDACLSDAQIAAFKVAATPIAFGYALASGETQYPGFNVWGANFGVPDPRPAQVGITRLGMGTEAPATPMPVRAPYGATFWDQWIRFFVTRDPSFDSLSLDPLNPGRYRERISALTALQDVNQADLGVFRAKGGKVLMAHGMSDPLVSTRASEQYFERVRATMGAATTAGFFRFYEIPGYGHGGSTAFNAAWDSLTALENWVEKGVAPPPQIVMDTFGVPGRTRPLCEYPLYPRYRGGDVDLAASFECRAP